MDEDAPAACNSSGSPAGLAVAAKEEEGRRMRLKSVLKTVPVIALIAAILYVAAHRPTVPGTEEVYTGIVSDRAMSVVEEKDCKLVCLCESRRYIGISFDDGGGNCFWIADVCEEPEHARPSDRVRIETAEEKGTGLRVVTKITLLEKLSF